MPVRPGTFVDWDLNVTDTSAPSAGEEADGWLIDVQPDRQVFNHLWNLYGRWIRWMDQSFFRSDDIWRDTQVLPATTTIPAEFTAVNPGVDPPTWVGTRSSLLPIGYLTASATLNGFRVGPIASPVFTVTDNTDAYFFLDESGTWTKTEVANDAGAPAGPANSILVARLDENTGTSTIDDAQWFGLQFVDLDQTPRATKGIILDKDVGFSVEDDGAINQARLFSDSHAEAPGFILSANTQGAKEWRVGKLATVPGALAGDDSHWQAWTVNARLGAFNTWANTVAADDSYLMLLSKTGLTLLRHDQSTGATWANTISGSTWIKVGSFGHNGAAENLEINAFGDATPSRDFVVTGINQFRYAAAQTIRRSIPGSIGEGTGSPVGIIVTQTGTTLAEALTRKAKVTGDGAAMWQLEIPNEAILQTVDVHFRAHVIGTTETRIAVRRIVDGTLVAESLKNAAPPYDVDGVAGAHVHAVTISAAFRNTIDHTAFAYELWVGHGGGAADNTWEITKIEYTYTITRLGA
jgi:hypothetical protein